MAGRKKRPQRGTDVEIFASACSGSIAMSCELGLPLVVVRCAHDADAAIADLREKHHAGGVLWPSSFQPIYPENGWNDWRLLSIESRGLGPFPPCGASFWDGRIKLPLPPGVTLEEFGEQLSGALRHLRYDTVVRSPEWIDKRCSAMRDLVVLQRYTLTDHTDYSAGASLVTDLYVLDPETGDGLRLLWYAIAARLASVSGGSVWR